MAAKANTKESSLKHELEECENIVCSDTKQMLSMALGKTYDFVGVTKDSKGEKKGGAAATTKKNGAVSSSSTSSATTTPTATLPGRTNLEGGLGGGCPLDKREIGDATWALLHTSAAYYPEKPTEELQKHAKDFMTGLAYVYPCSYCAKDFQEEIKKDPPRTESRESLSKWVCEQHNIVNRKLGLPEFKCEMSLLDERWKTGKQGCFPNAVNSEKATTDGSAEP